MTSVGGEVSGIENVSLFGDDGADVEVGVVVVRVRSYNALVLVGQVTSGPVGQVAEDPARVIHGDLGLAGQLRVLEPSCRRSQGRTRCGHAVVSILEPLLKPGHDAGDPRLVRIRDVDTAPTTGQD